MKYIDKVEVAIAEDDPICELLRKSFSYEAKYGRRTGSWGALFKTKKAVRNKELIDATYNQACYVIRWRYTNGLLPPSVEGDMGFKIELTGSNKVSDVCAMRNQSYSIIFSQEKEMGAVSNS